MGVESMPYNVDRKVLSNDHQYLWCLLSNIIWCLSSSIIKPGPVALSGRLTTAMRILRFYVDVEKII